MVDPATMKHNMAVDAQWLSPDDFKAKYDMDWYKYKSYTSEDAEHYNVTVAYVGGPFYLAEKWYLEENSEVQSSVGWNWLEKNAYVEFNIESSIGAQTNIMITSEGFFLYHI